MQEKKGYDKSRLFWGYWFPVLVYCAFIFIQSAYPSPDCLPVFPYSDKILHFFAYAVLGGLFFRAFGRTCSSWRVSRIVWLSVLLTTLYGVGDEIHQSFVVSRMAEGADVIADLAGGTFGAFCYFWGLLVLGRTGSRPSD